MKSLICLLALLSSTTSFSISPSGKDFHKFGRWWKRVEIPGAKCGNGKPYAVWVDKGRQEKISIELMGGGACWSKETCYGPNFKSWLFPIPRVPVMSMLSVKNKRISPVADGTYVYFPYCNADVWAGRHEAKYLYNKVTYHKGHENFRNGLAYLIENNYLSKDNVTDLLVYGASAGALGSFLHGKHIASQFPNLKNKTMIADAPGLHFGDTFWKKFPKKFISDIDASLKEIGLFVDYTSGNLSGHIKTLCESMSDWNIGVLQASRDYFMSHFFGEISQDDHHDLVFSTNGIWERSKEFANCSVWIADSGHHTLLLSPYSWYMKAGGVYAKDFAKSIISQKRNISTRDE